MLKGEGVPPTYPTLTKIMRAENCSISWLLGADGPPYLVTRTVDDAETAEILRQHLADETGWCIHLLKTEGLCAWVLHQPAWIDADKESIAYTAVSVIAGPSGALARQSVLDLRAGYVNGYMQIPVDRMRRLYAGQLGTFHLFGDASKPGWICSDPTHQVHVDQSLPEAAPGPESRVAESEGSLYIAPRVARELAVLWPVFQENERAAVTTLLEPFLDRVVARHKAAAN